MATMLTLARAEHERVGGFGWRSIGVVGRHPGTRQDRPSVLGRVVRQEEAAQIRDPDAARGEELGDVAQRVHDRLKRRGHRSRSVGPVGGAADQLSKVFQPDVEGLDRQRHGVAPSRAQKSGVSG
jgi:hypothetical protein